MKTTLVLLFASFLGFGQLSYPVVRICKVQQDTICTGDSLKVYILYSFGNTYLHDTVAVYIEDQESHLSIAWRGNYHYFNTLPKDTCQYAMQFNGKDSATVLKIKIPSSFAFPSNLNGEGTSRLGYGKVSTAYDNFSFNYKNCSPVVTNTNTATGIETYQLPEQTPTYYDMQGSKIELRYNELMIEQVGNIRKKVIYQDN